MKMPDVTCLHCDAEEEKPMNVRGSAFLDASYLAHQQKNTSSYVVRSGQGLRAQTARSRNGVGDVFSYPC